MGTTLATLAGRTPCLVCGYQMTIVMTGKLTKRKRSPSTFEPTLTAIPPRCNECGQNHGRGAGALIPADHWGELK
jgi:hypothetical protein